MRKLGLLATSAIVYVATISSGSAALLHTAFISGNDCGGKSGFEACHADTTSTYNEPDTARNGSPVIYKRESGGNEDFGNFLSIDGDEFTVSFNATTHELSWTYTPGNGDPDIHYFTIKQGNGYVLFYDTVNALTSATVDLDGLFAQPGGFSHVTWFDTGNTTCRVNCGPPTDVPEPATMALFGAGLLGLGLWRRRRSA